MNIAHLFELIDEVDKKLLVRRITEDRVFVVAPVIDMVETIWLKVPRTPGHLKSLTDGD
jgi:hypothetical protein